MATFNIWTIGCQMNTSDARKLSEELEEQGFRETEKARSADLVVLYSCMVRQHAEDKVRSKLGELRLLKRERPSTRIAVAGCVGDVNGVAEEVPVRGLLPGAGRGHVDPRQAGRSGGARPVLPDRAAGRRPHAAHLRGHHDAPGLQSELHLLHRAVHARARALADHRTTSCARSTALVQRGTREVVLLSQIAERYGRDLQAARPRWPICSR